MAQNKTLTRSVLGITKVFMGIVLSVIFYLLVTIGVTKLCDIVYDFSYQVFGDVRVQEAPGVDVDFEVSENESIMQVADRLARAKLIVNKYSFFIRAKLMASGKGGQHIQPGKYELNTSMTYAEMLTVMTGSDSDKTDADKTSDNKAKSDSKQTDKNDKSDNPVKADKAGGD